MTAAFAQDPEPMPFREAVAAELRAHLARRRISNRRLARTLGTTPAWIDRRLNGTTAIDTDDLEMIARALGIGPMTLIAGAVTWVDTHGYPRTSASPLPSLSLVRGEAETYRQTVQSYASSTPERGYSADPNAIRSSRTVNDANAA